MSNLKIDAKHIEWIESSVASSINNGKVYLCYANVKKNDMHKQIAAFLSRDKLPKTLKVTGKKNIDMKVACYQDDGMWFEQLKSENGCRWRLWVEARHLISGPIDKDKKKEIKK